MCVVSVYTCESKDIDMHANNLVHPQIYVHPPNLFAFNTH